MVRSRPTPSTPSCSPTRLPKRSGAMPKRRKAQEQRAVREAADRLAQVQISTLQRNIAYDGQGTEADRAALAPAAPAGLDAMWDDGQRTFLRYPGNRAVAGGLSGSRRRHRGGDRPEHCRRCRHQRQPADHPWRRADDAAAQMASPFCASPTAPTIRWAATPAPERSIPVSSATPEDREMTAQSPLGQRRPHPSPERRCRGCARACCC